MLLEDIEDLQYNCLMLLFSLPKMRMSCKWSQLPHLWVLWRCCFIIILNWLGCSWDRGTWSNRLQFIWKASFHSSPSLIWTLLFPQWMSSLVKYFTLASDTLFRISRIRGRGRCCDGHHIEFLAVLDRQAPIFLFMKNNSRCHWKFHRCICQVLRFSSRELVYASVQLELVRLVTILHWVQLNRSNRRVPWWETPDLAYTPVWNSNGICRVLHKKERWEPCLVQDCQNSMWWPSTTPTLCSDPVDILNKGLKLKWSISLS